MSASAQPTNMLVVNRLLVPLHRRLDAEMAAEVPAHPRRLRAVRCGAALSLSDPVPHAGRRSVSLLDWAVELLLLGADLFATQRRPVAAGTGRRASVARGERRAAAHQHPSHGLDVPRIVRELRCRVPDALSCPSLGVRQGTASDLYLLALGVRLGL